MTVTLLPNGEFAFPRSYIEGLWVRHSPGVVTWDGEQLTFIIAGPPDALVKVNFDARFNNWSSNRWTLGFVVLNGTYEYPPAPPVYDLPFYAQYMTPTGKTRGHILIDAMYGTVYSQVLLEGAPSDYWLPPPLS